MKMPFEDNSFDAVLCQHVTVGCRQRAAIDGFQLFDDGKGLAREGRLALEAVQNDALQQVSEGEIGVFREALEHFEQRGLDAHACLGAGNDFCGHEPSSVTNVTMLPR